MMEEEEETLFDQEQLLGRKETVYEKREWKRKILKTAVLSMSFFGLGLCIAIPGPTLLDLGRRVGRDIDHMTLIFTARSVGYLVGSLAGGILFDFFDQQLLLLCTMSAVAVATASVPWCTALLVLSLLISMQGAALGVLDTGGNIFCIRIWGPKSAPFMQVLHFAFGVGAFIAPLIARPFLLDTTMINMTRADYYPVNFKVISLESLSRNTRFVRDLSYSEFMDKNDKWNVIKGPVNVGTKHMDFNKDGAVEKSYVHNIDSVLKFEVIFEKLGRFEKKRNNAVGFEESLLSLAEDYSRVFEERIGYEQLKGRWGRSVDIARVNREEAKLSDNTNGTELENNTQLGTNTSEAVVTSTNTVMAVNIQPRKPEFSNGGILSKELADAEKINPAILDLKKNPPVLNIPSQQEVTTLATTTRSDDLNITTLAVNASLEANNTDFVETTVDTYLPELTSLLSTTLPSTPTTTFSLASLASTSASLSTATTSITTVPTTTVMTAPKTMSSVPVLDSSTSGTYSATKFVAVSPSESSLQVVTTASVEVVSEYYETTANNSTNNSSIGKHLVTKSLDGDDSLSTLFDTFIGMSKIQFAYALIGMLLAVNAGLYLLLYCKDSAVLPHAARSHEDIMRPKHSQCFLSSLILLLFFFFFTYMGMEVTFGGLLTTFAVDYPMEHLTPAEAATLTAVFWGCLAIGRAFAIFIARCFKPPCMMVTNLSLTVVGALMLSFAIQASPVMLWVGTVALGLGMSSLFPTTISWANAYYPLTGTATAVFVAGSGVGEMVIPVMTGYLYKKISRLALMYVTLILSIAMSALYLCLQLVVYQKGKFSPRRSHSGFMRLNNVDDIADAVDMDTIECGEDGSANITETALGNHVEERERRKENGHGYKTTEFTKLVELSD